MSSDGVWAGELAAYEVEQRSGGQAEATVTLRLSYLRRLGSSGLPVAASRVQLIEWMASHPHWAAQTRASARAAVVSFYRWRVLTGRAEANPAADLPGVKVPPRLPRPAPEAHVHAGTTAGHEHAGLMVELAARAGLRRSEIAALRREDLAEEGLWIVGKGGRVRLVPVPPALRMKILARGSGFLFPARSGGHVRPQTVTVWVRRYSGSNPHALRHRYATRAYGGSRDLFAVQRLLGHSSIATTQIYVAISPDALMTAVMAAA